MFPNWKAIKGMMIALSVLEPIGMGLSFVGFISAPYYDGWFLGLLNLLAGLLCIIGCCIGYCHNCHEKRGRSMFVGPRESGSKVG